MSRRDLLDEFELGRRVALHLIIDNELSRAARLAAFDVRFSEAETVMGGQ